MSEVSRLLRELESGGRDIESVAADFRRRSWTRRTKRPRTLDATEEDPEAGFPLPGSFEEVTAALLENRLTDEQFDLLARAAARR